MNNIKNEAFKKHTEKYDEWFDRNLYAYESELLLLRSLNIHEKAVEIGVGTGKFAYPLGIRLGIEPTEEMYRKAQQLGIDTLAGTAEHLPLKSDKFDWTLMVTTICFVNDPLMACREMFRVLKSGGHAVVAFVDKDTELGRRYLEKKEKSLFYKEAEFFSTKDVTELLEEAGFKDITTFQTLIDPQLPEVQQPQEGHGTGGFAAVVARKP